MTRALISTVLNAAEFLSHASLLPSKVDEERKELRRKRKKKKQLYCNYLPEARQSKKESRRIDIPYT